MGKERREGRAEAGRPADKPFSIAVTHCYPGVKCNFFPYSKTVSHEGL